ncbi:hypothetical protein V6N13_086002 [Hibiscus sabdariffa]
MAIPLVHMFPNSITLVLDGNWHIIPGDNTMNNTTATTTGPQSALIISPSQFYSNAPWILSRVFLVAKEGVSDDMLIQLCEKEEIR